MAYKPTDADVAKAYAKYAGLRTKWPIDYLIDELGATPKGARRAIIIATAHGIVECVEDKTEKPIASSVISSGLARRLTDAGVALLDETTRREYMESGEHKR